MAFVTIDSPRLRANLHHNYIIERSIRLSISGEGAREEQSIDMRLRILL